MTAPRFASVVLDVDSTVSGIEGIDWLARLRGGQIAANIGRLTADAMRGAIPLEDVYGRRLALIKPTRVEIDALSHAYIDAIARDCPATIAAFRRAGIQIALVSGGIRQALLPLASQLGVDARDLHAVDLRFDSRGNYASFDASSPLTTTAGKAIVVESLGFPHPILAVGDGQTDLAMRSAVDSFVAFTGFAVRDAVIRSADSVVKSFQELERVVLGAELDSA
jgi:phosphoserine phosphatase